MARQFFDEDGNELDPEDLGIHEGVDEAPQGMNRADVGIVLLLPLLGWANGLAAAANYFHSALTHSSAKIDERKRFAESAGYAIEALTGGE